MILRIFLPESVYRLKSIDGSKEYLLSGKIVNDCVDIVSVFVDDVIEIEQFPSMGAGRRGVGYISSNLDLKVLSTNHIALGINDIRSTLKLRTVHLVNFNLTGTNFQSQILLYDLQTFQDLCDRDETEEWNHRTDSISKLLLFLKNNQPVQQQQTDRFVIYRDRIITFLLIVSTFLQTKLSFTNSAFLRHFQFWSSNLTNLTYNKIWAIIFDVIAGITGMLWLWRISNADEYLIQLTMFIVKELQQLLDALKGSPVGLKLNVDLNNFYIGCFRYHVNLWATFLAIIAPLVKYLFAPLTIIGCFGLSFQLSMFADLMSIITLHARCIYTYASTIKDIEFQGLVGVWRVVSGHRKNILKDRIESYEYSILQLYISIILFAGLLFLLPTNLTYFVVFGSVQLGLHCITYLLELVQRKILAIPICYIVKWCLGQHVSCDNFEVVLEKNVNVSPLDWPHVSLFSIRTVHSSFPSWIEQTTVEPN